MILLKQAAVFGAVGMVNTAIDIGSYALLVALHVPLLLAVIVSTSLGFACSFLLNRRFTFRVSHTRVGRSIISFLVVTLVGLWVLQPVIIMGLQSWLSLDTTLQLTAAKVVATGITMVWNFTWYRQVVFPPPDEAEKA